MQWPTNEVTLNLAVAGMLEMCRMVTAHGSRLASCLRKMWLCHDGYTRLGKEKTPTSFFFLCGEYSVLICSFPFFLLLFQGGDANTSFASLAWLR